MARDRGRQRGGSVWEGKNRENGGCTGNSSRTQRSPETYMVYGVPYSVSVYITVNPVGLSGNSIKINIHRKEIET